MKNLSIASLLAFTLLGTPSCVGVTKTEPHPREVIALKHASADELCPKLRVIYGEAVQFVADSRSNSLVVVAQKSRMPEIQKVIRQLDIEVK